MATYKNIKGFGIQYLASDPTNPITGQVWFNSTSKALKGASAGTVAGATWASGGALNTARGASGGAGLQTSGLIFGGYNPVATAAVAITEAYNGSSWTE